MKVIGVVQIILHYYGSLEYSNLVGKPQVNQKQIDVIMPVTDRTLYSWDLIFNMIFKTLEVQLHDLWVLPVQWGAERYINENRYIAGDSAPNE